MSSQSGGGEYKFNFQDLSRFVNDVRYLFRTGGNVFQAGGGCGMSLVAIRENIISLILLIVLISVIYYVLFQGYPRIIMNVLFFSFYHKENMDSFLKKDNLLSETMTKLSKKEGYDLFDFAYKTSAGSQLYSSMIALKKSLQTNYTGMKPDAQLYESLKEYFLFQDKYQGTSVEITTPKEKLVVKNKEFYEQLLGLYLNLGKYSGKGKGDDQQLMEIYRLDEKQGFKIFKRASACKSAYDAVTQAVIKVVPLLTTPYLAYVVLPDNNADYTAVSVDFEKLGQSVGKPEIYKTPLSQVNPFSWFVIEVAQYKSNAGLYQKFSSEIQGIRYDRSKQSSIVKYLNLPPAKRKLAETRVFKGSLPPEFYNFVNKRPIFSHVFFSTEIKDKTGFYNQVMQVYLKYYKESGGKLNTQNYLAELVSNVKNAKIIAAYMHCLHLFMNVYKAKIISTYQDQNYANKFFFPKLFNPFFDDFVKNRVLTKIKLTFSKSTWSKSYDQFGKLWLKLGKILKKLITELPDQFG